MKTVLIIGATGTIGAYTALELKEKGYNVIATGRRKSDSHFFKNHGINYHPLDISLKEDFVNVKKDKIHAIIHCAGIMPARMIDYQPKKYIESILSGTLNVLDYAVSVNANRIIFTQTRADSSYLMGTTNPIPADIEKKFPLNGDHSIYTICKNAAVDLIEHYFHEYGLKRFILRLPTIYAYHPDPYYYVNGEKRWMAYRLIMEQAKRGEKIEIWGDPSRQKEITYIKDLTQIFEKCIETKIEGGTYNVGRGIGVTLEEQITGIVNVFSQPENKSKIIYKPNKPNARQFIHDISKTEEELGYVPKFDYLSLLKDFKMEMKLNRFEKLWGVQDDYVK